MILATVVSDLPTFVCVVHRPSREILHVTILWQSNIKAYSHTPGVSAGNAPSIRHGPTRSCGGFLRGAAY